ncbi:MAG: trimethylamine methyltransferase family protein [Bacillota bacterium]
MGSLRTWDMDWSCHRIHEASVRILERAGVDILHPKARELFAQHGASVMGDRVFIPQQLLENALSSAPAAFTIYSRNPARNVTVGGEHQVFAPGYGPPFVIDSVRGRRRGSMDDYRDLVRLVHAAAHVDVNGGPIVEPQDVPHTVRHLDMLAHTVMNSDKVFMGSVRGEKGARDSLAIASVLFGGTGALRARPVMISLINCITPLKYDETMLGALMQYAAYGQPIVIASFAMAGSSAPVTLAGLLALQNAEVLAGVALSQLVSPGAPVVYGSASAITDMRRAGLAVGAPETALIAAATAQMARFYNLPSRCGGALTDSKLPDFQAGAESMMNLLVAACCGANFILHAAGILEHYMAISYEKVLVDNELIGMVKRLRKGFSADEDSIADALICQVGPGGDFLTTYHTFTHFRNGTFFPDLADRHPYELWLESGERGMVDRGAERWQQILASFEPPTPGEDQVKEIQQYVADRKREELGD